jgi:hypothetical protein
LFVHRGDSVNDVEGVYQEKEVEQSDRGLKKCEGDKLAMLNKRALSGHGGDEVDEIMSMARSGFAKASAAGAGQALGDVGVVSPDLQDLLESTKKKPKVGDGSDGDGNAGGDPVIPKRMATRAIPARKTRRRHGGTRSGSSRRRGASTARTTTRSTRK